MPRAIMLNRMRYEVLLGICRGEAIHEQAERLNISEDAVKSRLRVLYAALGVPDAYRAIIKAWRVGILVTCPVCRQPRPDDPQAKPPFEGVKERTVAYTDTTGPLLKLIFDEVAHEPDHEKLNKSKGKDVLNANQLTYLQMIAAGLTNHKIAERRSVTEHTVRSELQRIYLALGAENRAEAVAIGFMDGYVKAEDILPYR